MYLDLLKKLNSAMIVPGFARQNSLISYYSERILL